MRDTDCPGDIATATSCSSAGLQCYMGSDLCTCQNGVWGCIFDNDLKIIVRDMSVPRDMTPAAD